MTCQLLGTCLHVCGGVCVCVSCPVSCSLVMASAWRGCCRLGALDSRGRRAVSCWHGQRPPAVTSEVLISTSYTHSRVIWGTPWVLGSVSQHAGAVLWCCLFVRVCVCATVQLLLPAHIRHWRMRPQLPWFSSVCAPWYICLYMCIYVHIDLHPLDSIFICALIKILSIYYVRSNLSHHYLIKIYCNTINKLQDSTIAWLWEQA